MNFNSLPFFGLLACLLPCVYGLSRDRPRQGLMLIASYVFYGSWDVRFLPYLASMTLAAWGIGLALGRRLERGAGTRGWGLGSSLLLLLPLAWFKYADFLAGTAGLTLSPGNAAVPLGISFITFQAISYVCDVASGKLAAERDLLRFALYKAFFPQLVSGPIVRASHFLPQLRQPWHRPDSTEIGTALCRFLWGMTKKTLIADTLATAFVDPVFAHSSQASGGAVILAVIAFSLQIYADFSGYSDMAIATARILGLRIEENFRAPYLACSLRTFWQRWHISLSTLIRDYVYFPLGGSRGGQVRTALNLLGAMALCGLWHGAGWTFVLWGVWHGIGLCLGRALPASRTLPSLLAGWMAAQGWVLIGWLMFRAPSPAALAEMIGRLSDPWPRDVGKANLAVLAVAALAILVEQAAILRQESRSRPVAVHPAAAAATGLLLAVLLFALASPDMDSRAFIYFSF